MLERHATLIFFFFYQHIYEHCKNRRQISKGDKTHTDIYFHSKDFVLDSDLSLKMPPLTGSISDAGIFLSKSGEFRGIFGCILLRVDIAERFVSPPSELANHKPFLVYRTVLTLHSAQVNKA